ncbi:unnamed protein product [Phyllotreta striolata]|uniref:t-SNARE coiled-coil homology domain-containing protein n=1 Tax=Phyllotreta striolata TaxID=444603 RepID=A0A9N9TD42_PHYSR|nr:unnamed protein product [Phyllotreta striolata]
MSLLFLEDDPWLLEHDSCEKLHRDIMEQLTIRQKHPRNTDKYSQLSASIRLRLKQYNNEVSQLNQKLDATSKSNNITPAEIERRTRQIEILHSKGIQIQKMFDEQIAIKSLEERRELVGIGTANLEISPSTSYSIGDLKETQIRMLGEQDEGLNNLSKIISRQKDIAHTISNEVDYHNEILDDLDTQIIRTDANVRDETRHVSVVDRKDKTCAYWITIILLFISIIIVVSV